MQTDELIDNTLTVEAVLGTINIFLAQKKKSKPEIKD